MAAVEINSQKSVNRKAHNRDFNDPEAPLLSEQSLLLNKQVGDPRGTYTWGAVILPFLFPALGGLLFGYDIGATSGAVISITDPELSGTSWLDLSSIEQGLVVSESLYGAVPGSILAFTVADSLGRRRELILAASVYILGSVAAAFAPTLMMMVFV